MSNFNNDFRGFDLAGSQSGSGVRVEIRPLMRMIYMWMGLGLLATAVVADIVNVNPSFHRLAITPGIMMVAIFAELGMVIGLSWGIRRLSPGIAITLFFAYAIVNGFTLSSIFMVYRLDSIYAAFFTTAALFGVMSVIGFTTQLDLTQYRTYFIMGLIGLLIAMVVNMFLNSSGLELLISLVGVVLFTALTAYDTQKLKNMAANPQIEADGSLAMKLSIIGALTLYLDFINLFLFLLRLMGGRRR
jgi:FtsH-binding integral membrane protein